MNYVLGMAFSRDSRSMVLIEKKNPEWMCGFLNGVGGKIEPGETPIKAMQREFREETGVNTSTHDWDLCFRTEGRESTIHFYRAFINIDECRTVEKERVF